MAFRVVREYTAWAMNDIQRAWKASYTDIIHGKCSTYILIQLEIKPSSIIIIL